jgi:hypothetical protein
MGTVHTCHQVNQLRPLHFVTPLLVIPRDSDSGTMLVSTAFYFLSERPCLFNTVRGRAAADHQMNLLTMMPPAQNRDN